MGFVWNPITAELDRVNDLDALQEIAQRLEITRIASEPISALQAVILDSDTTCALARNNTFTNANCVGVALNAAGIGAAVTIHLFGALNDAFFTFTANEPIYLSDTTAGLITNVVPLTGFNTTLGHGLGSGAIYVDIEEPIEL